MTQIKKIKTIALGLTLDFNENNIGVGVGSEAPLRGSKWSFGVEGGAFQNSNNNLSIYGVTYFERDMLRESPRSLRVGFFSGYARYPAEAANVSGIIPAIGDFIPVAGFNSTRGPATIAYNKKNN